MKIWLDENYNIIQEEERNFGRGNNKFDHVQVYIPSSSIERDDTLPTFIFETPVKKKYGAFAHDTPTWFEDNYTVFQITLNDAILSQNGELTITIVINFYNSENKIVKIRRVTSKGFVLDNIVINGEVIIIGNETTILESLNQKVDAFDKRIFETNNNLNILEEKTLRFGRYIGTFESLEEMYHSVLELFNYDEDTSSVASAVFDSFTYIFYNIKGEPNSFIVFDLKEKNFYVITFENDEFFVKKNFITKDEFDKYKSAGKDFYQIDSVSKLHNIPKDAVDEHPGIWVSSGGAGDMLLLKTQFAGLSSNTYYIAFYLYKGLNIKNAFMVSIYVAKLNEEETNYDIDFERTIMIPEILVNPDDESEVKSYIRTLRLNNLDYDLDYKKYTDGSILDANANLKEYVSKLYVREVDLKENYYNKEEVNEMHEALSGLHFEIVDELPNIIDRPDPKLIYLVPSQDAEPSDIYEEWVVINNKWELLGTTKIDLSNYVQREISLEDGRSVINHNGNRIEFQVEKEGMLAKTIYSKNSLVTSFSVGVREVRIEFIEGQIFITAPEDGMISLQAAVINLLSKSGILKSNLMLAGDEAKLNNSDIINRIILGNELSKKQDILVSSQNIKTINGQSILGSGDLPIEVPSIEGTPYTSDNPPDKVKDKYNNAETFIAYSKEVLAKDMTYLAAWSGYELRAIHRNQFVCTTVGQGLSDSEKTMARNNIGAMPYISINGGLMAESSSSDWGVNIGTQVAGWNDTSGGSFKFRKDCPNAGQMSLVIDGTVYMNEGHDRAYCASYLPDSVKDIVTGEKTTFAYSKPRMPINEVTWITVWNGFELRSLHKDELLNYNLLSNRPTSLPASDVYPWAKASTKPSYSWTEITGKPSVLLYTAQSLTDAQKAQARNNIGAGTSNFSGKYTDLTLKPKMHYVNIMNQYDDVILYLLIPDYGDNGIAAVEDILAYLETIGDAYIMCSGYGDRGNDIYVGIHCFGDGKVRLNTASGQIRTFGYHGFEESLLEYSSIVLNY